MEVLELVTRMSPEGRKEQADYLRSLPKAGRRRLLRGPVRVLSTPREEFLVTDEMWQAAVRMMSTVV